MGVKSGAKGVPKKTPDRKNSKIPKKTMDMTVIPPATTPVTDKIVTTIPPPPRKPPSSIVPLIETSGSTIASVEAPTETEVVVEYTNELFLKFSNYARPFGLPTYPEIALAGMNYFQQEGMICIPLRFGSNIAYKFLLREKVEKNGHKMEFNCGGMLQSVPLYTWDPKPRDEKNRKQGTLLTFQRAGQGVLGDIPAELFDAKMKELKLDLVVPTKMQRIKDTTIFNGNRFCVIETPENVNVIPESIPIIDPFTHGIHHVRVNFKGQERYCGRCNAKHVGQCPQLKEFYEARDMKEQIRKQNEVTTKIYSDSTLRLCDPLGLRSDVCTMSGGGLGQVVQASLDDPGNMHDSVVIMGGTNDIKIQNFTSNKDFAQNIDASLQKLAVAAKEVPEKSFILVQQIPHRDNLELSFGSTDTYIRELYLQDRIKEVAGLVPNIETTIVQYDTDHTGHPTEYGTAQILKQLHDRKFSTLPLTWNDNFIIAEKPYSRVESIYRYGCNACHNFGQDISTTKYHNQLLCDSCYDLHLVELEVDNKLLIDITKKVMAVNFIHSHESFPSVESPNFQSDANMDMT